MIRRIWWILAAGTLGGCHSPAQWAEQVKESQLLREEIRRLGGQLAEKDQAVRNLKAQVDSLAGFGAERQADLFAPVRIEIASLSGGADYDGLPGDDGITVHLRPRDADGDTVKAPGSISVQLLDNSIHDQPRVLGVYEFVEPEVLRRAWHGRFATNHYTLHCPFPEDAALPESGRLLVHVRFVDFLTGRTLTAAEELSFHRPARRASR